MNIEAIDKTIAAIKAAPPHRVKMSAYFRAHFLDPNSPPQRAFDANAWKKGAYNGCGTAACIAGWTILANVSDRPEQWQNWSYPQIASVLLDVCFDHKEQLFQPGSIGARVASVEIIHLHDIDNKLGDELRKRSAIRVLEILRNEERVDWKRAIEESSAEMLTEPRA